MDKVTEEEEMTKQEMIEKARATGMDGFYYPGECGCLLEDAMACGITMDEFDCENARKSSQRQTAKGRMRHRRRLPWSMI